MPQPPKWERKQVKLRITPRLKRRIRDTYDALMVKGRNRDKILRSLAITYSRSTRQIERYIAEVASEEFTAVLRSLTKGSTLEGRALLLDKSRMSRQANESEIIDFYNGGPLSWRIIAAHADVSRDQQGEILRQLEKTEQGFRILCIVAEYGAGKSTLAWRVAYELYQKQSNTVIHLVDNSESEFWYRLTSLTDRLDGMIYILVDDIFRYEDVVQAIRNIDAELPVIVIATSRSNEYKGQSRLGKRIERVELKPLSPGEKTLFLNALNKPYEELNIEDQERVKNADSFLTLGMELIRGRNFHEIIREAVNLLEENDYTVYRAYEYVCFCHQYGISIPAGLLCRIDQEGRFYNITARETAVGVLYEDELRPGYIRTKQEAIASIAFSFFSRDPRIVFSEIIKAIDIYEMTERFFLIHMTRIIAQRESKVILQVLASNQSIIDGIAAQSSVTELAIWRSIYQGLKMENRSNQTANLVLLRNSRNGKEASKQVDIYLERGQFDLALDMLLRCLSIYRDDPMIRNMYLSFIKKKGTPEQVEAAFAETSEWLAAHSEHISVRQCYLSLLEVKGTTEQVREALIETGRWLDLHLNSRAIWNQYVVLAGTGKTPVEAKLALEKTHAWLINHPRDAFVYCAYLSLVRKIGDTKQVEQAIIEVQKLFDTYGLVNSIFLAYLNLVDERGYACSIDIDKIKTLGFEFLTRYPKDQGVEYFASWLRKHSFYKESKRLYTEHLLKIAPGSYNIRYGFGKLLFELKQYDEAASEFREVLRLHKGHAAAHNGLGKVLAELGDYGEAEMELKQAIYWAKFDNSLSDRFNYDLGVFYISRNRDLEAIDCFQCAISENSDKFEYWWRRGYALLRLNRPKEALEALKTAQAKAPENLQLPASEDIPALITECEKRLTEG
jgi:tetratricopeptide (TPR) repeat protein